MFIHFHHCLGVTCIFNSTNRIYFLFFLAYDSTVAVRSALQGCICTFMWQQATCNHLSTLTSTVSASQVYLGSAGIHMDSSSKPKNKTGV